MYLSARHLWGDRDLRATAGRAAGGAALEQKSSDEALVAFNREHQMPCRKSRTS